MLNSWVTISTAALVLALATSEILGLGCDFNFSESIDGRLTRIQVGDKVALIQLEYPSKWQGTIKSGANLITCDQTGQINTMATIGMPDDEQADYESQLNEPLERFVLDGTGGKVYTKFVGGAYLLEKLDRDGTYSSYGRGYSTTFAVVLELERKFGANDETSSTRKFLKSELDVVMRNFGKNVASEFGQIRFVQKNMYAILHANETATGYNHAFFFQPTSEISPVVVVGGGCNELKILPYKLSKEIK